MSDSGVEKEPERLCSYYHKPPQDGKKLKRCSRCHKAWYHDAHCQRSDFAQHKSTCRKQPVGVKKDNSEPLYIIEAISGRGKGLVANRAIQKHSKISATNGWMPLVAPVLQEQYRSSRCALCFNILGAQTCAFSNAEASIYRLLFCSSACRHTASKEYHIDEEAKAIQNMLKRGKAPPKIFSTAILLYRILLAQNQSTISDSIETLQSQAQRGETGSAGTATYQSHDDVSSYHTQAVIATVMGMLHCSNSSTFTGAELPSMEYLTAMIQRIKLNGLSICDGEFVCYGVGLFSPANFMNHSCQPNALQTFLFEQGKAPSLHVTAFDDIAAGQEICISYTDTSCPSHLRQKQLETSYFFDCRCEACSDVKEDIVKMGVKCLSCKKACIVAEKQEIGPRPISTTYRCNNCKSTLDDLSTLSLLKGFEERYAYDNKLNRTSVEDCRSSYDNLKERCTQSSWYVQEAGERLLQAHLDKLSECPENSSQQQQTAHEALQLCEELLHAKLTNPTTSQFLRRQQLKYKAAKLRLFIDPDPRRSIQELQEVLSAISPYYPPNHELLKGLQGCLRNVMM